MGPRKRKCAIKPSAYAKAKPTHQEPNRTSPLLALPPELRTLVFELAVIKPEANMNNEGYDMRGVAIVPPLAQACRQLRDEVLPIFYGGNVFGIGDDTHNDANMLRFQLRAVFTWLERLEPEHRAMVGKLVICNCRDVSVVQRVFAGELWLHFHLHGALNGGTNVSWAGETDMVDPGCLGARAGRPGKHYEIKLGD